MNVFEHRRVAAHLSLSRAVWVVAVWAAAVLMAIAVTVFGSVAASPERPAAKPPAALEKLQGIAPNSPDAPAASDLLPPQAY